MIPVEIDLERVRRERAVGIRGLGQPLKSFRDRRVEFDVYRPEIFDNSYLEVARNARARKPRLARRPCGGGRPGGARRRGRGLSVASGG